MTTPDWRLAGYKSDATKVQALMRARYDGENKARVRARVVRAIAASGATTVLDFWSGGHSADALIAAGLNVVSVENGSQELLDKAGRKVSRARIKRAVELLAPNLPYSLRFGDASKHLAECDAAFLDFCGHYTSAMGRMLRACRHMKCVVVTVMPERTEWGRGLTIRERQLILTALLTDATGLYIRSVEVYERSTSGQDAIVVALTANGEHRTLASFERNREYLREYQRKYRERNREYLREYQKRKYREQNHYREQKRKYREQNREYLREYQRKYRERLKAGAAA